MFQIIQLKYFMLLLFCGLILFPATKIKQTQTNISHYHHNHLESGELSANKLDQNSNYFNRVKPSLQSNESINKCRKCASGSSQLHHRSEHDMYGSKLSTRMQDSAKSAWKASKHFASSVITGGVGLSSCRQCTSKSRGSLSTNKQQQQQQVVNGISLANQQRNQQQQQQEQERDEFILQAETDNNTRFAKCSSPASMNNEYNATNNSSQMSGEQQIEVNNSKVEVSYGDDDQHTSVIKVGPTKAANPTAEVSTLPSTLQHNQNQQQVVVQHQQARHQDESGGGLIRVDENNKLTIVTKFNDSDHYSTGPNTSIEMGAPTSSGSGSERSRCESSSSGRGTSSDAGSSASQNGDLDGCASAMNDKQLDNKQNNAITDTTIASSAAPQAIKKHKRKSSLFKANKLFGGSQASLNKFKNFFTGSSSNVIKVTSKEELKQQQQQLDNEHLERSRLRCMELNQASSTVQKTMKLSEQSIVNQVSDVKKDTSEDTGHQDKLNNNIISEQEIRIKAVELGQGGCDQVEVNRREKGDSSDFKAGQKQEQQQVASGEVLIVGS